MNAEPAQQGAYFPDIGGYDKVGAHSPAGFRRQNARNTTVFESLSFAFDRAPETAQCATGADRRREFALRDGEHLLDRQLRGDSSERELQVGECGRQVPGTKAFESLSVQELGPECPARQRRDFTPPHSGSEHGTNQTAGASSAYNSWSYASFG
jgi:hypothetical protein